MKTYWLSFAGEEPPGRVVIVDAESAQEAAGAGALWARPGDELLVLEVGEGSAELSLPRNRELTEKEIRGVGALQIDEAREQGLVPLWEES